MAVSTGSCARSDSASPTSSMWRSPSCRESWPQSAHAMYSIVVNKYYVDELYDTVIVWPIVRTSREFLWKFVDIVDDRRQLSTASAGLVRGAGAGLRRMQSGYVRTYAGWILFGGVLVMAWFLR